MKLKCTGVIAAILLCPTVATAQDGVSLGEGVEVSGELGLRYQVDPDVPETNETDHRFRLAAAVGASFRASEHLTLVTRIANARSGEQRDGHVELGGLDSIGVGFDRAFARYQRGGLIALAGVIEHLAGSSSLVWDEDLIPAGGALQYSRRLHTVTVTPLAFAYLLRSDDGADPAGLVGGELGAETLLGNTDVAVAGATYRFIRKNALANEGTRNSLDENGNFQSDFVIVEGRAKITIHELEFLPLELSGEFLFNPGADSDNRALAVGLSTTRQLSSGTVSLGYRYREVERDAVVADLSTDDFPISTTVTGHDIALSFEAGDHVALKVSAFIFKDRERNPLPTESRGRLDLNVVF